MACGSSTGGFSAILYIVDAADRDSVPISRSELHELFMKPSLSGIPLHVLCNKIDKSEANSKQALMDQLGLELIRERERSILLHDFVQRQWKHRRLSLTGL